MQPAALVQFVKCSAAEQGLHGTSRSEWRAAHVSGVLLQVARLPHTGQPLPHPCCPASYLPGLPERPTAAGLNRLRTARVLEEGMVITVEPGGCPLGFTELICCWDP